MEDTGLNQREKGDRQLSGGGEGRAQGHPTGPRTEETRLSAVQSRRLELPAKSSRESDAGGKANSSGESAVRNLLRTGPL